MNGGSCVVIYTFHVNITFTIFVINMFVMNSMILICTLRDKLWITITKRKNTLVHSQHGPKWLNTITTIIGNIHIIVGVTITTTTTTILIIIIIVVTVVYWPEHPAVDKTKHHKCQE